MNTTRRSICTAAFVIAAAIAPAAQDRGPAPQSWSGVVINSTCTADEAFAQAAKCVANDVAGAALALYDDTTRQLYSLEPQHLAAGHLGDSVVVSGVLVGTAVHVTSLKKHTAIGLAVGRKAPAFSARDQFGRQQTLTTLKGR